MIQRKLSIKSILFLLAIALSGPLAADTVLLRNGQVIKGKITAQSRSTLTIQTATGRRVIPRGQMRRIAYGAYDPAAEKRKAAEAARKQEELRKKQLELFEKQQEAWKKQQEEQRKQAEAALQKEESARSARQAEENKRIAEARREEREQETGETLRRSLLFPGWGQVTLQDRAAGYVYGGAFALGLIGATATGFQTASLSAAYVERESLLNLVLLVNGESRGGALDLLLSQQLQQTAVAANEARARSSALLILAGAAYAANIADVVIARPAGEGSALRIAPAPGGVALALEIRF